MFYAFTVNAQITYENSLKENTESLEGKLLNGYSTVFDFSREKVRRGWWEYAKKFGNPINMKTYYKVKISSDYTDGNVNLILYAKTEVSDGRVDFFLGIEEGNFNNQIKSLIMDFKRGFYIKNILERIENEKGKAVRIAHKYNSKSLSDKRSIILDDLSEIITSIDSLKHEIKGIMTR